MSNSLPPSRRPRSDGHDAQQSDRGSAKGVFVHPLADCQSVRIGKGSKVWQFTIVLPGAVIGRNCNINSHCFIENDVVIGNNVTVKCGIYLWDGMRVGDDFFLGPNATFTNDRFPRSRRYPKRFLQTIIKRGASVGAGAVILPGLTIGERALVGAGAIVTRNVAARAVIRGQAAALVRSIEE
jgi:UDP-2-acetamido-3-amino-2,3-dideoxy-glucuronate N-acetyltransferase